MQDFGPKGSHRRRKKKPRPGAGPETGLQYYCVITHHAALGQAKIDRTPLMSVLHRWQDFRE